MQIVVHVSFADGLVDTSEAGCFNVSGCIKGSEVGQGDAQGAVGCPASLFVEVSHAQFVHPYLTAFDVFGIVTHSDHDRFHFGKARVTDDTDFVQLAIRIVFRVEPCETHIALSFPPGAVTSHLQVGQHFHTEIDHVFCRPDGLAVVLAAIVVVSGRCQVQRNFIFVIVVFIVGAETQEDR